MKKIIKNLLLIIFVIVITVSFIFGIGGYSMYKKAIEEVPLKDKIKSIKSIDGYTTLNDLPEYYINAVIAAEDYRFKEHGAIDIKSICRAIVSNVKNMDISEGGSTITQQLAKNSYFSQKKEITRKVAEIYMAYEYENNCTKEEILELYLNTCYFGDGCYTVSTASKHYFSKEPSKMTLFEATMLAGIPNAPSAYSPSKNIDLAKQRQKQVLNKMVKYGYLTQDEANNVIEEGERYVWNIGT